MLAEQEKLKIRLTHAIGSGSTGQLALPDNEIQDSD
jgi:hypothetical protein